LLQHRRDGNPHPSRRLVRHRPAQERVEGRRCLTSSALRLAFPRLRRTNSLTPAESSPPATASAEWRSPNWNWQIRSTSRLESGLQGGGLSSEGRTITLSRDREAQEHTPRTSDSRSTVSTRDFLRLHSPT